MKNKITNNMPDVLVTDFDRTLTCLYRDPSLLIELAEKIVEHYSKSIIVPEKYLKGKIDGYFVWHDLYEAASHSLPQQVFKEINSQAENIVTDFELQIIKRIGLFSGVADTIKKLHTYGLRLGVVSSNATSVVEYALREAGILKDFEYIDGRPYPFNPNLIKPNPYPLQKALSSMKVMPDSFWYVGDDVLDMVAAKAAYVSAVGVCTGKCTVFQLQNAGADLVISSFNDIVKYLGV